MSKTLQEIKLQYGALTDTLALFAEKAQALGQFIQERPIKRLLFTGCGSSFMIACSARTIASARLDIPVVAMASGDLWLHADRYEKLFDGALIVSFSRSGRTSEVLNAYETIKEQAPGVRFLSILCAEDTPLEALSDFTFCLPWAFDESVCQTRCVSNLYAAGALLIGALSNDPAIAAALSRVAQIGPDYLEAIAPALEALAAQPWDHAVVLADGEIDGLAEEGALAFKEISQLQSNFYHLLDVRHGPMVLINEKSLVIANLSTPPIAAEQKLLHDVIAKGALLLCYSPVPIEIEGAKVYSLGEDVGTIAGGLGLLLICQLISYYKSFYVGCDPDRPDGLSPWIEIK